jgi:hypothetical protein
MCLWRQVAILAVVCHLTCCNSSAVSARLMLGVVSKSQYIMTAQQKPWAGHSE